MSSESWAELGLGSGDRIFPSSRTLSWWQVCRAASSAVGRVSRKVGCEAMSALLPLTSAPL